MAFLLLIIAGHTVWLRILEPSRSFATILSDTGFWVVTAIFAVPMGLGYFLMAKNTTHNIAYYSTDT